MPKILSQKLKTIKNDKGDILKFFSKNNKFYSKFGEVYFSEVKQKQIKAWKMQKNIYMNLTVPVGRVKFVFYDLNFNHLKTIIIGKKKFFLLNVPPQVWYGFQGLNDQNLIVNFIEEIHNDDDMLRLEKKDIIHNWSKI